jgi:L-threonylcarbamoyladenylate synthase
MTPSNPPYQTTIRRYGKAAIAEAADLIRGGYPVAVPTETVYGLAADATSGEAVARIYEAKGRPSFNPLIVHVLDLAAAEQLGVFSAEALALGAAHWPGPLTLVVPRHPDCPVAGLATAGLDTIAIRVPAHRAMRALLEATGLPLAAPSANASGRISPTRASHVEHSLAGRIQLIIDDGPASVGIESTIVLAEPGALRILRAGPVAIDGASVAQSPVDPASVIAPGQLTSHYAPAKPLRLNAEKARDDEWMIGFGQVSGDANLSLDGSLLQAAARLFDELHIADQSDRHAIAVARIEGDSALAVAINDRLNRAASA